MSRYLQFRDQREVLASGKRDRPVTIQKRPSADSVDTGGTPTEEGQWSTLSSIEWMARVDLGAIERFSSNQPVSPVDTIWVMTYRVDMDPEIVDVPKLRRLRYHNRTYDITGASLIGANEGIELQTLARSGA